MTNTEKMDIPKAIVEETKKSPIKKKKKSKKKRSKRCFQCNKKLKLMEQIKCNCGNYFCPKHMNRHSHNCTFDVKAQMKTHLEKNNPKMEEKMIKI